MAHAVERSFRNLTERQLRRGVFKSLDPWPAAITADSQGHNENPRPFIWTAKVADILEKANRARAKPNTLQTV